MMFCLLVVEEILSVLDGTRFWTHRVWLGSCRADPPVLVIYRNIKNNPNKQQHHHPPQKKPKKQLP